MTLLLGPPASGKTTLLRALAGRLDPSLKVKGEVTYNGYKMNEFVPQKTAAYISQNDVHVGEMTVKETFDFSARCQGVGSRYELLSELARREKDAGIFPEAEVDLFMKATAMEGVKSSLQTDYTLRVVASPADLVKVRMQADGHLLRQGLQPRYTGIIDAFTKIIQTEGAQGLWRGVIPNTQRAFLVSLGELACYHQAKCFIINNKICGDNTHAHTLASIASGLSATT